MRRERPHSALRLEFFRKARAFVKKLNPNFLLMGETTVPEARAVRMLSIRLDTTGRER